MSTKEVEMFVKLYRAVHMVQISKVRNFLRRYCTGVYNLMMCCIISIEIITCNAATLCNAIVLEAYTVCTIPSFLKYQCKCALLFSSTF